MQFSLTPVPLIDGHSQAGELRYIIPGECHIVLVEHLQGAYHIVFRETAAYVVIPYELSSLQSQPT